MSQIRDFHLFLDQVQALSRLKHLTEVLLQLARKQGFRQLTIVDASKLNDGSTDAILTPLPSVPSQRREQLAFDPRICWSRENDVPNTYEGIRLAGGMDDAAWQQALQVPQPEPEGLVVPVYRNGTLSWHVEFAGPTIPTSRFALACIHVAAVLVHDRVLRALEKVAGQEDRLQLTPQEAACIHWASLGKTNEEIGKIMGISSRTARFHIDNVRQKCGAKTRTQAIVMALSHTNASPTGYAPRAA